MTISNEPDEDADNLDDEGVLDSLLGQGARAQTARTDAAADMPDWPPSRMYHSGMALDNKTTEWFKSNHADWFGEMEAVLRAWVDAQERRARRAG